MSHCVRRTFAFFLILCQHLQARAWHPDASYSLHHIPYPGGPQQPTHAHLPWLSLSDHSRALLDTPVAPVATPPVATTPNITVVRTPQQLQAASLYDVRDIEIREHMDLRRLARAVNPAQVQQEQEKFATQTYKTLNVSLIYAGESARSIRGNCSDPDAAKALGLSPAEAAGLLPLKPRQCLLIISDPFLTANGPGDDAPLWVDRLYLKTMRPTTPPNFAQEFSFISAGFDTSNPTPGIYRAALYLSNMTLQSEWRRNAKGVTLATGDSSAVIADSVFSDWEGSLSPLRANGGSVINTVHTTFRNMHLAVEIADVSRQGSVRFEDVRLANVTLQRGAVVSTSENDYEQPASHYYLWYYAEDDEEYDVKVEALPPGQGGEFGADRIIRQDVMGDCVFVHTVPEFAVQPGCPNASVQQRERVKARSRGSLPTEEKIPIEYFSVYAPDPAEYNYYADYYAPGPAEDVVSAEEYADVFAEHPSGAAEEEYADASTPRERYRDRVLSMDDAWILRTRAVLPSHQHDSDWPVLTFTPPATNESQDSEATARQLQLVPPLILPDSDGIAPAARSKPAPGSAPMKVAYAALAAAGAVCAAAAAAALLCLRRRAARARAAPAAAKSDSALAKLEGSGDVSTALRSWRTARAEFASSTIPSGSDARPEMLRTHDRGHMLPGWTAGSPGWNGDYTDCSTCESGVVEIRPIGFHSRHLGAPALSASTDSSSASVSLTQPPIQPVRIEPEVQGKTRGGMAADEVAPGGDQPRRQPRRTSAARPGPLVTVHAAGWAEHADRATKTATASGGCHAVLGAQRALNAVCTEPLPGMAQCDLDSLAARSEGSTRRGGTVVMAPYTDEMTTPSSDACMKHMHTEVSGKSEDHTDDSHDPVHAFRVLGARAVEDVGPHALGGVKLACAWPPLHVPKGSMHRDGSTGLQAPGGDIGVSATDMQERGHDIRALKRQLDSFTPTDLFLDQFVFLGSDARRQGGQAVVQFARGARDRVEYAIKFFLDQQAFRAEAALYAACSGERSSTDTSQHACTSSCAPPSSCGASELHGNNRQSERQATAGTSGTAKMSKAAARFLPRVEAVCDGTAGGLADPRGRPLPPCIVMEKGESLQDWSERAEPDLFTSLAVLSNISQRLADMHDAGYVHRDLKPANVMWLPRENRWTVIDFGCAARAGEDAPLCFTLAYAPPEVAIAAMASRARIQSDPAMDAWSLGVMAYELMTGAPAFRLLTDGRCRVIAMLRGEVPLPWEGWLPSAVSRKLGQFKGPIMQLLNRDPAKRVSVRQFHHACTSLVTCYTTATE
eukprot:jgi/Ulvmu1/2103/UM125_0007.1